MTRVNPFKPNSPVNPGMFVGRLDELDRLEAHLRQTRAGRASNFMVTGERGIGKSSLLNFLKWVAQGSIPIADSQDVKFLVIDIDIDQNTTQLGLVRKIELGLRRELGKTERARQFLRDTWAFLQRVETKAVKVNKPDESESDEMVWEEFCYSLAEVAQRLCDSNSAQELFSAKYDGILVLIDEADNASKELSLGAALKLMLERLERRDCSRLMLGLAGLAELRQVLAASHPSSLRLFEEIPLGRLSNKEVNKVIDRCLEEAGKLNGQPTTITEEARKVLVNFSEGYPHFIQQFGFSAFETDTDGQIDQDDVLSGALGKRGAMEQIGDRYYRDSFYNKIQEESYRQVLRIMANNLDSWITKREIRDRFKGSTSTLDNAIQALRQRKIILSKEGSRGIYRLQHKGFALWIKFYTADPDAIAKLEDSSGQPSSESGSAA